MLNHLTTFLLFAHHIILLSAALLPDASPIPTKPHNPLLPPPTTIPAFPEQSDDVSGCPLVLSDDLFTAIKSSCVNVKRRNKWGPLYKSRCCPVLAAWLYSAYAATALGSNNTKINTSYAYDLPLLPEDSETCSEKIELAMSAKGVELAGPNATCDVAYCYCGIRLRPLSCPEAFAVSASGELVGRKSVKKLERACSSGDGLDGCSTCLNATYMLDQGTAVNATKFDNRTNKMHAKDCELMGLTWLLAKNRSAYIHTVSNVLRAMMSSTNTSNHPQSCSLNSDGMPLAVDSSEINDQSSSSKTQSSTFLTMFSLLLLHLCVFALFLQVTF